MEKIKIPKRESGVSRVVATPEEEKTVLEYFEHLFKNPNADPSKEFPKSPELIRFFEEVNHCMTPFVKKYGGRALDLKPEHLHLIDTSKLKPEYTELLTQYCLYGHYSAKNQAIFIFLNNPNDPKLKIAEAVVHEMLHFQAFDSFELETDGPLDSIAGNMGDAALPYKKEGGSQGTDVLRRRRAGLVISSVRKKKNYFRKTDEAVISELAKRFAKQYFPKIAYLAEELTEKKKLAEQMGGMKRYVFQKEVSYISKVQSKSDGTTSFLKNDFAYPQYREKLRSIIENLYQKNKPTFNTREEIFKIFAKASITGRLLPLARLFEKTYGPGAFKKWAEEEVENRN